MSPANHQDIPKISILSNYWITQHLSSVFESFFVTLRLHFIQSVKLTTLDIRDINISKLALDAAFSAIVGGIFGGREASQLGGAPTECIWRHARYLEDVRRELITKIIESFAKLGVYTVAPSFKNWFYNLVHGSR